MNNRKTLFQMALSGDFDIEGVVPNINRCREISKELNAVDLIDLNSIQIGLLAELSYRTEHMPELESVDMYNMEDKTPQLPN